VLSTTVRTLGIDIEIKPYNLVKEQPMSGSRFDSIRVFIEAEAHDGRLSTKTRIKNLEDIISITQARLDDLYLTKESQEDGQD
jgi:hypothetical protein